MHFWKRGDEKEFSGFTANISEGGTFIGTASPFPRGTRIRVEILDETLGFTVEGIVAHAARVSPQLQKLKASGMGIRFLKIEDLVGELKPTAQPRTRPTEPQPPEETETKKGDQPQDDGRELPVLSDDEPGSTRSHPEPRVYPLRFSSFPDFLAILHRDIEKGGVFIPTDEPAEMREKILVEVQVPAPVDDTVQLEAFVVGLSAAPSDEAGKEEEKGAARDKKEDREDEGGDNLTWEGASDRRLTMRPAGRLRGMAVEFTDAEGAFDAVTEIVYGD